jgi:cytochrome c553
MGTLMTTSTTEVNFTKLMVRLVMILGFALMGISSAQAEGSIKDGSVKARACQVCHGKGGHSTKETYPILAGQHAAYLRKQLIAFRAGTRKDPIMNGMAAPLSDQDIEDVAAFFNSNK